MKYEWDEFKNIQNQEKHGISFEAASELFDLAHSMEYDSDNSTLEEDRFIAKGYVPSLGIIVVSHCAKDGDTIRIISARKVKK